MIYNGYNDWFRPLSSPPTEGLGVGYFFFLGNTDPKKNTERTLVAYSRYLEQSDMKRRLLMADLDRAYLNDIIVRNHIENIRDHIDMPGYILNSELPKIYNNAFAFLYTSLRESFGIPLLEAMACGTPVITSNTSSMPEIGGPDAILINPEKSEEITEMMLRLERDEAFYQQQKAYCRLRVWNARLVGPYRPSKGRRLAFGRACLAESERVSTKRVRRSILFFAPRVKREKQFY